MARLGLASRWVLKRRDATIGWMEMPDTARGITKVGTVPYLLVPIPTLGNQRRKSGTKMRPEFCKDNYSYFMSLGKCTISIDLPRHS
jgi:hypothetical protein